MIKDEEQIEVLTLGNLKDQLSVCKHALQKDSDRQPLSVLVKRIVKGKDPPRNKEPALHERERQRIISVLKLTHFWWGQPSSAEPPDNLFEGLVRPSEGGSNTSSQ